MNPLDRLPRRHAAGPVPRGPGELTEAQLALVVGGLARPWLGAWNPLTAALFQTLPGGFTHVAGVLAADTVVAPLS
jgi:hypothetical protein